MKQQGFTLIELMVVVAIISLLAGIGYPTYTKYITDSRRTDAISLLLSAMQKEQQLYTQELEFTTNLRRLGYNSDTPLTEGGHYQLAASRCTPAPCVKLTAIPKGIQYERDNGQALTLDSLGRRTGNWNN